MPRHRFRDRFFTPKVAEAMMSPSGILLAGVGVAAGILAGVPLVVAAGIGAVAWGGRVLAAVPSNPSRLRPATLSEPWRGYAADAEQAKRRFDAVVARVQEGPLRDRLAALSARLDDGVDESWRIATRGHEIVAALGQIDTAAAGAELDEIHRSGGADSASKKAMVEALEAQLAAAERLRAVAERSRDQLRLLDARFDELIARAVEVSVGTGDTDVLGHDVDQLVGELESLRVALEETEQIAAP